MAGAYENLMMAQEQAPKVGLWDGLMQQSPQAPAVHTIGEGPEYNKWDEALQAYGRIRIPKQLDNPQVWLNATHFKSILENVDRQDLPDGSVILSRRAPMS